ncbi:MAG: BACON domain-containing protein [Bacteroidales bacterium]|nr:BACON domain-containing protein [Bacteroidales bacterium]
MFKQTVYILAAACLLSLAGGCTKSKTEIADVIVLSRTEVAFSQAGGNAIIGVGSPSPFTADCGEEWVSVTPSANAVAISVSENASSQKRVAKVQLSAGNATQSLTVIQSAALAVAVINAPESIELDSEVDSVYFSVDATCAWTVESEADWLSAVKDEKTGVVKVKSLPNEGTEDRTASVKVNKANGESASITVNQICRANNPYFNFIGSYDLYAEDWYLNKTAIGAAGFGTGCTIEAKEYGKSFIIKDLFHKGTVNEAVYDKKEGTLSILTGRACLDIDSPDGSFTIFYLAEPDFAGSSFETNNVVCQLGTGFDEEKDPNHTNPLKVINVIRGIGVDRSFGLVGYFSSNQAYGYFSDLYYAAGEMYFVARSE